MSHCRAYSCTGYSCTGYSCNSSFCSSSDCDGSSCDGDVCATNECTGYNYNASCGRTADYYAVPLEWSPWSAWSTTPYTQTKSRKVESGPVYSHLVRYTIKYNLQGGSGGAYPDIAAIYDSSYTLSEDSPTRTNYIFKGWNRSSTATTAEFQPGASVSNLTTTDGSTVTLYAVWQEKAANPITYANQTWTEDFSLTPLTKVMAAATNTAQVPTYSLESQKNASNNDVSYFTFNASSRVLTMAANTPAGTYTVKIKASIPENDTYKAGSATSTVTVTVNKVACDTPVVTIATDGKVTWPDVYGAASYSISINGTTWQNATSGIDFSTSIKASKGRRTVYVRANPDANHTASTGNASVNVFSVKLTAGAGITNVTLDGTTSATSTEKLYIENAPAHISATPGTNMVFKKWVEDE